MNTKTIKISEDNYRWLLEIAAELQKARGKVTTFDDVLCAVKQKRSTTQSLLKFAGRWKISDKKVKELEEDNRKLWRTWKI